MDNKPLLYGIIGLLLGVGITTYVASNAVNTGNEGMMQAMGIRGNTQMMGQQAKETSSTDMGMGSSMQDMMGSMMGESGDDFDRAFMEAMIVHHQGAIDMAKQAQTNARHDEIKSMARDIISAQTKEINMMKQWQTQWGY